MRHAKHGFGWISASLLAGVVIAAGVGGKYVAEGEDAVTLQVEEETGGAIRGTLSQDGMSASIRGRRQGEGYAGTIGMGGEEFPFTMAVRDGKLVLDMEGETTVFRRAGAAAPGTAKAPAPSGTRKVTFNGKRWTDEDLARVEAAYRIRIPDADYWYDPVLGAWGVRGSPTLGFISPGLDLGGPIAPDASGGGTGVFINGRELPPSDLAALQTITGPVPQGRYFLTAQGIAGYEGGPPMWDLGSMIAQAQQGSRGGSWQSRFSSGISDGETIGVFLPNGGIVSVGP
jgi:hypothetical protein